MDRQQLQAIVSAERRNVPQCNWQNYDLECAMQRKGALPDTPLIKRSTLESAM